MARSWSTGSFVLVVAALTVLPQCCGTIKIAVTPVQQVISMLEEMKAKGTSALTLEQKTFEQYSKWVHERKRELGFEMTSQTSAIEELTATIDSLQAEISQLARGIGELDSGIAKAESERSDATAVRTREHAEYMSLSEDYGESVDALERAIETVKAQDYDRPQAEVLLQSMAKRAHGLRRALAALQEETSAAAAAGSAPAVAAYTFQSQSLVEVLETLLEKFKQNLQEAQEEEGNSAHEHELQMLHLKNLLQSYQDDRAEKASAKGEATSSAAVAKGELAATQKSKVETAKLSSEISAQYDVKAATFQENQKVRADELEAIAEAIQILQSPEVSESYAEHVNLAQLTSRKDSFVQLTSASRLHLRDQQRAASLLQRRSKSLASRVLADAASMVAEKPFAKVITMIEKLLARLKEEASEEADHKAWCDKELKNNKLKRDKKALEADQLHAAIDGFSSEIASMAAEISELMKEQEELTGAMQEATKVRTKESAENKDTIKDAKAGGEAVQRALAVLQEFYSGQASLLQAGQRMLESRQVPEMAAYKGMHGSKKGVIGLLEVIASDFSRLAAETKASEMQAAQEYSSFMAEAKASMETKHKSEVKLSLDKDQAEFEKSRKEKALAGVEEELAQANKYYSYLKPNCVKVHVSYEERVARREDEIQALKEAYEILDRKSSSE